jgi:hypothetical protein
MEIAIFLACFFFIAIVLGPIFGAESRPGFLRPDRKPRRMAGAMRRSEWDR